MCNWFKIILILDPMILFQIVIEGLVGSGYRGDIAIDDVAMTSGSCSQGIFY